MYNLTFNVFTQTVRQTHMTILYGKCCCIQIWGTFYQGMNKCLTSRWSPVSISHNSFCHVMVICTNGSERAIPEKLSEQLHISILLLSRLNDIHKHPHAHTHLHTQTHMFRSIIFSAVYFERMQSFRRKHTHKNPTII